MMISLLLSRQYKRTLKNTDTMNFVLYELPFYDHLPNATLFPPVLISALQD